MLWSSLLFATCTLPLAAMANKGTVNQDDSQVCSGMYAKDTWGGSVDPFISFDLKETSDEEKVDISVVVFDYQDIDVLGKLMSDGNKKYVCDHSAVNLNLCDQSSLGKFIVDEEKLGQNKSQIFTFSVTAKGLQKDNKYQVQNTGYYCVATYENSVTSTYKATVNFRNSFGQIAASEYPKLPLYALLAIAYAIGLAYYGFNFWTHKHEILPLQRYLLFFFAFLTIETVLVWSLFDLTNAKAAGNVGVKVYVVFVSILNGFKFTFSFFLLLIISSGYGIVVPKLERRVMRTAQYFSLAHFISAVFYIICDYLTEVETDSILPFLSTLPVFLLTGAFYCITLMALSETTKLLVMKKQMIKLSIYRRLSRTIFISLLVLILGICISVFIFIGMSTTELIEQHWKTRFFFLEFWPSLMYFFIFNIIAFILRPTDTSYMLAASTQLPTDPENAADFELDDVQSLQPGNDDDDDGYQNLRDENDSLNLGSDDESDDNGRVTPDESDNGRNDLNTKRNP